MKILINYFYQFIYQFLNLIVPLITLPYVTTVLGAENYGIYIYSLTVVSYLILFTDFGLRIYGSRKISYVREDMEKKTEAFWSIFFTKLIITISILMVTIIIFLMINLSFVYWLQLLGLLISIFDISWFYQGIEKFKEIAIRNLIIKIFFIVFLFVFIKKATDINLYIIIVLLATLIGNLILYLSLKGEILKPTLEKIKIRETLKESSHLFLPEIAIKLYTSMDRIMLGYFLLKEDVGYYDIANRFLIIIMIGITTFGSIMLPKISNLFYKNEQNEIKKLLKKVINYYFMFSIPLILGIIGTSRDLVLKFLGSEYLQVVPVINLMSFTIIFWTVNNVTGSQILIPMKKEKILTKSVFVGSIVNFGLNIFLIQKVGLMGVVVATFITEGIVTAIQVYFSREYLKIDFLKVMKYLFASILMYIFIQKIQLLYLKILLGMLLYLFLMVILKELDLRKIKLYLREIRS